MQRTFGLLRFSQYRALALALVFVSGCKATDGPGISTEPAASYTNVSYGTNPAQVMDIVLPAGRTSATATVVLIHGGAWSGGDKSVFTSYDIAKFVDHGYAVANINYRLASNAANVHDPMLSLDITAALDFLTARASQYIIRPGVFGVAGHSAGAHLSLLAAYSQGATRRIKVVASLSGPTDLNEPAFLAVPTIRQILEEYLGVTQAAQPLRWTAASPVSIAVAGSTPTIIIHGVQDILVPVSQAQKLDARLTTLGVAHEYHAYPLYNHDLAYVALTHFADDVWNPIIAFFDRYLR